jgi:hypothetical protein
MTPRPGRRRRLRPRHGHRRDTLPGVAGQQPSPIRRPPQPGTDPRPSQVHRVQRVHEPRQQRGVQVLCIPAVALGQVTGDPPQRGQGQPDRPDHPRRLPPTRLIHHAPPHRIPGGAAGGRVQQDRLKLVQGDHATRQPMPDHRAVHRQRRRLRGQHTERLSNRLQRRVRSRRCHRVDLLALVRAVVAVLVPPATRALSSPPPADRRRVRLGRGVCAVLALGSHCSPDSLHKSADGISGNP